MDEPITSLLGRMNEGPTGAQRTASGAKKEGAGRGSRGRSMYTGLKI
jgi:hypothetical protein